MLPRRTKSRLSTFAFGASFFEALAEGCGSAFTEETAICGLSFLATLSQVLFTGSAGTPGIIGLLTSGVLEGGFAGRGGRTGGVEAMNRAMVARRFILMESKNSQIISFVNGRVLRHLRLRRRVVVRLRQ